VNKDIYLLGFSVDTADMFRLSVDAMFSGKINLVQINFLHELKKIDTEKEIVIIIHIQELNLEQRKFIWQFKINFPQSLLVFCSKDFLVANFSWQSQAVFFLPLPASRRAIALMMKKIEERRKTPKLKIKLNYQGGFDLVNSDDICFCEGDGNYTTVHLKNTKSILLSKKLKFIYQKLSPFPEIIRLGKSYIINTENIIKVDDNKVYFSGQNTNTLKFQLSPIYIKRLKEHLLMFTL
jgi:DNA-binding LytR/AlgR family response regulator